MAGWCQDNNLSLNMIKTKEMIVDYRKKRTESILTGCIAGWYGNCSASDRKALQRIVQMAHPLFTPLLLSVVIYT